MEGTSFGRYRLVGLLGRGGMGEVWRAYDTDTDRVVALKVLPEHLSEDAEFQRRFRREAHAAARLNSPHVIPIHHYGEIEGRLYVDMRLIEGRDLSTVLADRPLEPARAVRVVEQVAKALHAAHQVGLLHRDIKPSNILLDDDDYAYLIDFGIAHAADETRMTRSGNTIGTFAYIAPERLDPQAEEDARADIYSLACVLYESLTGQPPFAGSTMAHLIAAHLSTPPPRASTTQPDVPPQFDDVIATGMAKDPNERYATTVELADAAREAITPIRQPSTPTGPASTAQAETMHAGRPPHRQNSHLDSSRSAHGLWPSPYVQPAPLEHSSAPSWGNRSPVSSSERPQSHELSRGTKILFGAFTLGVVALVIVLVVAGREPSGGVVALPTSTAASSITASTTLPVVAAHQADVRVYNISEQPGVGARIADRLRFAGFNVTEVSNLFMSNLVVTTVYFSEATGERDTAEAVGKQLSAPVEPRISALADQPPGVIVLVAG